MRLLTHRLMNTLARRQAALRQSARCRRSAGLTLIELMIVVSLIALLIVLAAPSFQEMILMQRLRGVNAQIVTDLQFARAEAAVRQRVTRVKLDSDAAQTCYVIYVSDFSGTRCDCRRGAGAACTGFSNNNNTVELRTVSVARSSGVSLAWPTDVNPGFGYDPVTGGLVTNPQDFPPAPRDPVRIDSRIDDDRRLVNIVTRPGRPTVCAPNGERMGVTQCVGL